jgi:hypothetical protein
MLLVDAVIEIAQSDVSDKWRRYCEIAPIVLGNVPDAPRKLLDAQLRTYDGTLSWASGGPEVYESRALAQTFWDRFVAAVHAGHRRVCGIRHGKLTATNVDPRLITFDAFKRIKRVKGEDQWELAGAMVYGVDVVMGPPPSPELRSAPDSRIHDEIDAEYTDCEKTGRKPPNVKEIGKPVQDRLHAKGLNASLSRIQELAGDQRYTARRRKAGKTVASERERG